jgi:hypothetical protein
MTTLQYMEPPYNPGIWQALLVALRAEVRH